MRWKCIRTNCLRWCIREKRKFRTSTGSNCGEAMHSSPSSFSWTSLSAWAATSSSSSWCFFLWFCTVLRSLLFSSILSWLSTYKLRRTTQYTSLGYQMLPNFVFLNAACIAISQFLLEMVESRQLSVTVLDNKYIETKNLCKHSRQIAGIAAKE